MTTTNTTIGPNAIHNCESCGAVILPTEDLFESSTGEVYCSECAANDGEDLTVASHSPHSRPITTLAEGKEYLRSCVSAGLVWHLEDDPEEIINGADDHKPLFSPEEIPLVRQRVAELYALPSWGEHGCPIGYMSAFLTNPKEN